MAKDIHAQDIELVLNEPPSNHSDTVRSLLGSARMLIGTAFIDKDEPLRVGLTAYLLPSCPQGLNAWRLLFAGVQRRFCGLPELL